MTVLTPEQGQHLLAAMPRPEVCDLCLVGEPRNPTTYGPFTIYLCSTCQPKWLVGKMKGVI